LSQCERIGEFFIGGREYQKENTEIVLGLWLERHKFLQLDL